MSRQTLSRPRRSSEERAVAAAGGVKRDASRTLPQFGNIRKRAPAAKEFEAMADQMPAIGRLQAILDAV